MKKTLIIATMALLITTGMVSVANAYQGDPNVQGPDYSPERHEAMTEVFETKDYNAWKEIVGNRPIVEKISAEQFERFLEARQLAQNGKIEEANEIRKELNLGQGTKSGMRKNGRGGLKDGNGMQRNRANQ
jgi:uncharacterized protein YdeI (BOF family)